MPFKKFLCLHRWLLIVSAILLGLTLNSAHRSVYAQSGGTCLNKYDLNCDGAANVLDVRVLVGIIFGGTGGGATPTPTTGGTTVTPTPTTGGGGGKYQVTAVTASADDGNVPANAIDGNLNTRWSASGDGQWIQFDVGTAKSISSIKIAWYLGDARVSRYDIQVSSDGSTWATVKSGGQSSGTTTQLESTTITAVSARYVRIVGHMNSVNAWNSITEVELWGSNGSSGPTATVPPTVTPGGPTSSPTPTPSGAPVAGTGIWISPEEIAALTASGTAWDSMRSAADASIGSSALYFQDSKHPQSTLAVALVAAKKGWSETCGGGQNCREKAAAGILDIMDDGPSTGGGDGRVLALGRNLAAYIIAADIIDLPSFKPADDQRFKTFLKGIQQKTSGYPGSCASGLIWCHDTRPNNWGTMAGASRIALDLYLGDQADLDHAITTFKGYIGDYNTYHGFVFQSGADSWACDPGRKTPLNPDCTKSGVNLSGAPIDDVQRCCGFTSHPVTNYAWGGFSAAVAQAEMLSRAGYPAYDWENQAIKRGMEFLVRVMPDSASDPTDWMPWVVNHHYGTSLAPKTPTGWGRLMAWTDWTHQ